MPIYKKLCAACKFTPIANSSVKKILIKMTNEDNFIKTKEVLAKENLNFLNIN